MATNERFREKVRDIFPLMAKRGRVSLETCPLVDEH